MNLSRMGLILAAAVWFALPALAAPAPAPATQGPLFDVLRLQGMLPRTAPLLVRTAMLAREGVIEVEHPTLVAVEVVRKVTVMRYVVKEVAETVQLPGGRTEQIRRKVYEAVPTLMDVTARVYQASGKVEKKPVSVKSCKFFLVSKEGQLEALEAAKATALLKKGTAVLIGESAEVDSRHLELIKPGTLYLAVTPPPPEALPPPLPPRE